MRKVLLLGIAVLLLDSAIARGIGFDYPPQGKKVSPLKHWPAGLADLINSAERVHGFVVNASYTCYFRGDTTALNEFLDAYSRLPGARLQLVLHSGTPDVKSPWDVVPRNIAADWKLHATPSRRKGNEPTGPEPRPFVTRVDVWLGGSVKLDQLKIPENLVEIGGEVERQLMGLSRAHCPARSASSSFSAGRRNALLPEARGLPQELIRDGEL